MAQLLNGPQGRPMIQLGGQCHHVVTSESPVTEDAYDNLIGGTATLAGAKTFSNTVTFNGQVQLNAGGFFGSGDDGVGATIGLTVANDIFNDPYTSLSGRREVLDNFTTASPSITNFHSGSFIRLNKADGIAITLPAAASGLVYTFVFETSAAGGSTTITAASGDLLIGGVLAVDTDTSNAVVFDDPDGSDDLIMTFNGTTQGGLVGSWVRVTALSGTRWLVQGVNRHSGDFTTIFS